MRRRAAAERGVPIAREMTGNFGVKGDTAHAFHVFDPDGNMIELHAYEFVPRRGRVPMGRYLWLARVTDKARAVARGRIFDYVYPCPVDRGMLERWGVTLDEFAEIASRCDDAQILHWAESRIPREAAEAANSWLCTHWWEDLDRQDREEGAFAESVP